MLSEQQQRIMGYFIEEAKDHLNTIEQGLLNLKATIEDPEMANEVFRAAHSVKGGAAMLGLTSIQHTAHRLEDYFKILKECQVQIDQKLETLLLRVYDTLAELLEQLQGPFGLTDDKAEEAMAGVEPVFIELNNCLSEFVNQAEIQPHEDVNLRDVPIVSTQAQAASHVLSQVTTEESALRFIFQNDVPARLREMLQLFKQTDSPETRQQLQGLCQTLSQPGEQLDLPDWCELIEMAERTIANPINSYRTLAPIIIKDIKRAQEQILTGNLTGISASEDLRALLPPEEFSIAADSVTDTELANLLGTQDSFNVDELELFAAEEILPEAAPLDLDTLSEVAEGNLEGSGDGSNADLPFDFEQFTYESNDSSALNFDLIDQFNDQSSSGPDYPVGPEVGVAELNTLADLFEGEAPELELSWQEETIDESASIAPESLELHPDSDFSELLFQNGPEELVIDDLAADLSDLLNPSSPSLSHSASDVSDTIEFDFGEFESAPSPSENLLFDLNNDDSELADPADIFALDIEATTPAGETESSNTLDNLDDLFAGLEEDTLSAAADQSDATAALEADNSLFESFDNADFNHPDSDLIEELALPSEFELEPTAEEQFDLADLGLEAEPELSGLDLLAPPPVEAITDPWADTFETPATDDLESAPSNDLSSNPDLSDLDLFDQTFDQDTEPFTLDLELENDLELGSEHDSSDAVAESDLDGLTTADASLLNSPAPNTTEAAVNDLTIDELGFEPVIEELELSALDQSNLELSADEAADLDFSFDAPLVEVETEGLHFGDSPDANPGDLSFEAPTELTGIADTESEAIDASVLSLFDEAETGAEPLFESADLADSEVSDLDLNLFADSNHPGDHGTEERLVFEDFSPEPTNPFMTNLEGTTEPEIPESINLDEFVLSEDFTEGSEANFLTEAAFDAEQPLSGEAFDLSEYTISEETTQEIIQETTDLGLFESDNVESDNSAALEFPEFDASLFDTDTAQSDLDQLAILDQLTIDSEPMAGSGTDLAELSGLDSFDGFDGFDLNLDGEPSADTADFSLDREAAEGESLDNLLSADSEDYDLTQVDALGLGLLDLGTEATEEPVNEEQTLSDLDLDLEPFETGEGSTLDFDSDLDLESFSNLEDSAETAVTPDLRSEDSLELDLDLSDWDRGSLEDTRSDAHNADLDSLNDLDELLNANPSLTEAALPNDLNESSEHDFDTLMSEYSSGFGTAPEDLGDLDAILEDDILEDDSDFESSPFAAESAEFGDLEAMLAEDQPPVTAIYEDEDTAEEAEEDFADLEALLGDSPAIAEVPIVSGLTSPPGSESISGPAVVEDEFSDLEALLQDADQTLGVGSSAARKSAATTNRRPNRRSGISDQTMRVSVRHLDNLNNLVGEMVVNRNSLEQAQERLRQFLDNLLYQVQQLSDVGQRMRDLYERSLLESSLLSGRRGGYPMTSSSNSFSSAQSSHATGLSFDALEMDRFTGFHTLSQEMIELIVRVRESASDIDFVVEETDQVTRNFRQITTQLQEGLTRSRMVPFAQTADRLPRGVRDNSLKYGKQAELVIEGRDTLIDKMIVEQLYDPMTHLVNNAIAHGIETPEERIAAGKSPTGRIVIRTFHQGNQTVISVSDDGAGINPEKVRAKALAKGLITAEQAREMSRLDTYDLLFYHGFSTVDQVDDLRGRGVGLDVVRSNLNEIRGTISIDSTIGKGTTFTIRLPLTLSISKALCCISNRARIAFPMDGVEDMLDVPRERIRTDEQGRSIIQWRDMSLPFQHLSDLLHHNRVLGRGSVYGGNQEEDMISIVVLRSAGNFLALQVDQVLGEQEIVIKQLEGPIPKPLGVAGATVLGDGRIMPIADVLELIDLWQGRVRRDSGSSLWDKSDVQLPAEPVTKSEPTVLIVDDSITVRELLSMTFSKVGYRVEQARDGQEAWEKLRSGLPCDLVFCDIEMPRMDGLELLSRIQKDANLSHLPIAMLTSRGADRHRQMAIQLGAKGYFTKPYLEEVLLDAAQRMLKGEIMATSANTQ